MIKKRKTMGRTINRTWNESKLFLGHELNEKIFRIQNTQSQTVSGDILPKKHSSISNEKAGKKLHTKREMRA